MVIPNKLHTNYQLPKSHDSRVLGPLYIGPVVSEQYQNLSRLRSTLISLELINAHAYHKIGYSVNFNKPFRSGSSCFTEFLRSLTVQI